MIEDYAVMNLETWNRSLPHLPIFRLRAERLSQVFLARSSFSSRDQAAGFVDQMSGLHDGAPWIGAVRNRCPVEGTSGRIQ
ncbi:hypothetical protein CKO40_14885 [Halochromatium glycolicum]|uniref:Uncharacterized protein n=1 Tax=Halochromatium glycolicum TaxID=85075 RepID=A0AAJ0U5S9_9GAMM|nr:hypothetical protein [Halochromatium glycolicum]